MKTAVLRKYAELIVRVGANVQKGQDVIVYAELDQPRFVEYVVADAYKAGARTVTVRWSHNPIDKIRYKKESLKALSEVPQWIIEREKLYVKTLPATIYLVSDDPDAYKGINQVKLAKVGQAVYPILKPFRDERENKYQWTIAGIPGPAWAKKVFPDLPNVRQLKNCGRPSYRLRAPKAVIPSLTGTRTTPNLPKDVPILILWELPNCTTRVKTERISLLDYCQMSNGWAGVKRPWVLKSSLIPTSRPKSVSRLQNVARPKVSSIRPLLYPTKAS